MPDAFGDDVGTMQGTKVKLHVKEDATSKFCRPSPEPFALKPAVERELDRMEKEGMIECVEFSKWATLLVSTLHAQSRWITERLCSNYKGTVNPALSEPCTQ